MTDHDLLVIGAGPAGAGAAYRAARAGHDVLVLEARDRPGGTAASIEVGGQRVDLGSHRLHPAADPAILRELRHLLEDRLQRRERNGRLLLDGRWVGFPLRPSNAARTMPPAFVAKAALDTALSWTRRPRSETFADHLWARLGPTMCESFYFPYARKLWGLEPERLSVRQAHVRVSADSPLKLLKRLVAGTDPQRRIFYYPRGGFGEIPERLTAAAAELGATVRFGTGVTGIEPSEGGVKVTVGGDVVTAGRVFSTAPITTLVDLVSPPAPPEVREAARALRFRAMVLVYLVCATPRYTHYDAHYLPAAWTPATRVSEPKNYRDGDDPPDRTVLCAEIPCAPEDDVWSAPDGDLARLVRQTLVRAGLPDPPVADVVTVRLRRVYPVYEAGFEATFARLDAWTRSIPRVLTFGRQGLFVHDNSHHALAMAWSATDALRPDGGFDDAAWAAARRRFEDHVVED